MKTVKEISVKLENKPGELSRISELLAAGGINILALTVRTEGPMGTLSFVATDPARASNILQSSGYSPFIQEVIAVETPHHPGGLNAIFKALSLAGVNVEYLYSWIGSSGCTDKTILLLGVDNLSAASEAMSKQWIKLYGEELYNY
jgi:hypothetical protein